MSGYTKGPWEVIVPADGIWPPRVFAGSKFIVMVNNSDDEQSQLIADARLIAAAPDLLECLEMMTTLCRVKYGNLDPGVYSEIEKARAAIAKARGES